MNSATHRVRVDVEGKRLVSLVCGTVEIVPFEGGFRLIGVATPFETIMLPRCYPEIEEARVDCNLLNNEEHPCGFPAQFRTREHTISSTMGAGHGL
jgi:hypothetical protein